MEIVEETIHRSWLVATQKRVSIDFTLDDARLEARCPLDNSQQCHRLVTRPQYCRCSLGQLGVLPLEILTKVLLALDLPTLTTSFRSVNSRAMNLVDNSLHQYRRVVKYCPDILRAIISINARSFDCTTLYKALSTEKCESCYQRFGAYLYLITCKRVCYFCLMSGVEYLPLSVAHVSGYTGLSGQELLEGENWKIPCIYSLPGRYGPYAAVSIHRKWLFDRQAVFDYAASSPTTPASMSGAREKEKENDGVGILHGQADDNANADTNTSFSGTTAREMRRYASIISAPFFDSTGQSADWGFYCHICDRDYDYDTSILPESHWKNKYAKEEFIDHLKKQHDITATIREAGTKVSR